MSKTFKVRNHIVEISDDLEAFNEIYSTFNAESLEYYSNFLEEVAKFDDVLELTEFVGDFTNDSVSHFAEKAVKYINKHGVHIKVDQFYDEFAENYFWTSDLYWEFCQRGAAIISAKTELELLRRDQRDHREIGQWSGMGFGIRGAIKGAVKASLLNLGTDIAVSLGDSVVDAMDRHKIKKYTKSLATGNYIENYAKQLHKIWLNIAVAAYEKLVNAGRYNKIKLQQYEMLCKIAETKKSTKTDDEKLDVYLSCISQYPYDMHLYRSIFSLLNNMDLDVAKIAAYFGLKNEAAVYYAKKANEYFTSLYEMPECTPTDCELKINALNQAMKDFSIVREDLTYNFAASDYFYINEAYNLIMADIRRLTEEAYTYEGKTFSTAAEKMAFMKQRDEERRREAAEYRAAMLEKEKKKKKIIAVISIIVIFIGIIFVPKLFHNSTDKNNKPSSVSSSAKSEKNMNTAEIMSISPLYPKESEYFEGTYVPNYHRWLGGAFKKKVSDIDSSGKPYISYLYYYDKREDIDLYGQVLIDDGFKLRVDENRNDNGHDYIYRGYTKHDPEADGNQQKSLQVHLFIYEDHGGVTIKINHAG